MRKWAGFALVVACIVFGGVEGASAMVGPLGALVKDGVASPGAESMGLTRVAARYCYGHHSHRRFRYCSAGPTLRRNYYFPAYSWDGNVYQGWQYPYYGYPNCGYPFERSCW
jgi:hypothetical protein